MIMTLKSYLAAYTERQAEQGSAAALGRGGPVTPPSYNSVAMGCLLAAAGGVSVCGLLLFGIGAWRNSVVFVLLGLLVQVIGVYLIITTAKESANLRLVAKHFKSLSKSAQDEIITAWATDTAASGGGVLKLIEKLMNFILGILKPGRNDASKKGKA